MEFKIYNPFLKSTNGFKCSVYDIYIFNTLSIKQKTNNHGCASAVQKPQT